jgi:hypothetical protein
LEWIDAQRLGDDERSQFAFVAPRPHTSRKPAVVRRSHRGLPRVVPLLDLDGPADPAVDQLTRLGPERAHTRSDVERAGNPRNAHDLRHDSLTGLLLDNQRIRKLQELLQNPGGRVHGALQDLRSILTRSINRAQRRDKVRRNVVLLCDELPTGKEGRPSKSLNMAQAEAVLDAAEADEPRSTRTS